MKENNAELRIVLRNLTVSEFLKKYLKSLALKKKVMVKDHQLLWVHFKGGRMVMKVSQIIFTLLRFERHTMRWKTK